jgi:hypothetical protein
VREASKARKKLTERFFAHEASKKPAESFFENLLRVFL